MKKAHGRRDGMTQVTVALPESLLIELNKMATADMRSRNGLIVKMLSEQVCRYEQGSVYENDTASQRFNITQRFLPTDAEKQDSDGERDTLERLCAPRKRHGKHGKPEMYTDATGAIHLPGGIIARRNKAVDDDDDDKDGTNTGGLPNHREQRSNGAA